MTRVGIPCIGRPQISDEQIKRHRPHHFSVAVFAFKCSSNTELQTATHSLQMYTCLTRSAGLEMSASTSS
jgi:hypothetical protein